MQRVAIVATASGCGKTTSVERSRRPSRRRSSSSMRSTGRRAGPSSTPPSCDAGSSRSWRSTRGWSTASYRGKLGDLVLERADTVVWLDLPRRVWLPRLVVRTLRRALTREELWNGNRESLWGAISHDDSLFRYALANDRRRRHSYPAELARFRVARLRTQAEVDAFLRSARRRDRSSATQAAPRSPSQMGVSTT